MASWKYFNKSLQAAIRISFVKTPQSAWVLAKRYAKENKSQT